jgi:aerobic carbon-monoxide dehydrogenase medium subunit
MKPACFGYARPESIEEALDLLRRHGDEASVLAGGQSLVPMLNLRMARPGLLVDINRIPGLDRIEADSAGLTIGARARHVEVMKSHEARVVTPLLPMALAYVAHPAIRNRGTLGGSLSLADPAAELPACVVCLNAQVVLASSQGTRHVEAGAFFQGIYATALRPDEMIVRVNFPRLPSDWRFVFLEVSRRHGDYAMAGIAVAARTTGGRIAESRVVFCGLEVAPRRMTSIESCLDNTGVDDEDSFASALEELVREAEPISGAGLPATYRLHLAGVLLRRALDRVRTNGSA